MMYRSDTLPDLVTSVPLHWTRAFTRGFNQSELLSRFLAVDVNRPYQNTMRKLTRTQKQQDLDRRARLNNLKQAFEVKADVNNKHIAVVDDVVTTGATAETLATLLKAAGARRVDIWALARTPKT